jgi:hypothetical protein
MLLFWFQSLRHHARRWFFLILLVGAFLVIPLLLWVFLDLRITQGKTPSLLFLGEPIGSLWISAALQDGVLSSSDLSLQNNELLFQIRLFWALILWPAFWWLLLLWVAESTSRLVAAWLHAEVVGWFFSAPLSRTQWAVALFLSSLTLGLALAFAFLLSSTLFLYGFTGILFLEPFLGILPLALALALMASLCLLLACLFASSPPAAAMTPLLFFSLLVSYLFVPSFFHQIIEPLRSTKVTLVYHLFSWLWPPFAWLALMARKSLFLLPSFASLLHALIWLVLSGFCSWRLLLRRPL